MHRMRRVTICIGLMMGSAMSAGLALFACGGANNGSGFGDGGGGHATNPDGSPIGEGDDGGPTPIFNPGNGIDGGHPIAFTDGGCAGLQCAIAATCKDDGGTTIIGKVMDPAGANPLYNVLAYVPMFDPADPSAIPAGYGIEPITGGVSFPTGVTCDSCSYLYTGNPIAIGTSGTDGTFTITNAPSGKNIPIVVQVGKWRTHTTVSTVTDCNAADAGSINLPASADGTDPIVSIPQIAISMGSFDSLECLPYRLGMAASEFTSGASTKGHIHVFTGGGSGGGASPPESSTALWDTVDDLKKYDVTLFSCEGSETTNAKPDILEQYVNAGGRAFTSHYHYAWLAGPLQGGASAGYTANADWGTHLASWNSSDNGADFGATIGGEIATTLNVGGGPFAKGIALEAWLGTVKALGTGGVGAAEVAIEAPSFDPKVTSANTISQPWATFDTTTKTDDGFPTGYFSFNTPVNAVAPPDGGAAPYCGRVVFSGLHVGAAASDTTGGTQMPTSSTCSPGPGDLSPQEKVLEFMLFDLSSCVTPDTAAPGVPIPPPPPPPPPK
jgi:hypothetical protein